jgi:hypothetical protein
MSFKNPDPRTYERAPFYEDTGIVIVYRRHGSLCFISKNKALH